MITDVNIFIEKVRSMSSKEIILAMIEGLENPTTEIDMSTFGEIDINEENETVCFGCAATNTIASICSFNQKHLVFSKLDGSMVDAFKEHHEFVTEFEIAIDYLRKGDVFGYNKFAETIKIATIQNEKNIELAYLNSNYDTFDLANYKKLAKAQ